MRTLHHLRSNLGALLGLSLAHVLLCAGALLAPFVIGETPAPPGLGPPTPVEEASRAVLSVLLFPLATLSSRWFGFTPSPPLFFAAFCANSLLWAATLVTGWNALRQRHARGSTNGNDTPAA